MDLRPLAGAELQSPSSQTPPTIPLLYLPIAVSSPSRESGSMGTSYLISVRYLDQACTVGHPPGWPDSPAGGPLAWFLLFSFSTLLLANSSRSQGLFLLLNNQVLLPPSHKVWNTCSSFIILIWYRDSKFFCTSSLSSSHFTPTLVWPWPGPLCSKWLLHSAGGGNQHKYGHFSCDVQRWMQLGIGILHSTQPH